MSLMASMLATICPAGWLDHRFWVKWGAERGVRKKIKGISGRETLLLANVGQSGILHTVTQC